MIEALTSDDGGLRGEAALFFLKREPAMGAGAMDTLADQMVDPLEGSYLWWDLVKQAREASPGSMTALAARLLERLARASKPETRSNAISALGEVGPVAAKAVPVLLESASSKDLELASGSIAALREDRPARGCVQDGVVCWNGSRQVMTLRSACAR